MALFLKRSLGLRTLQVSALNIGQPVAFPLYHETATPVLMKGDLITAAHLRALSVAGINELYECQTEDAVIELAAATPKSECPLDAVPVGSPTFFNIYDGDSRFLLRKGGIMTSAQQQRMRDAKIGHVYINKDELLEALRRYDLEMMKFRAEAVEKEFEKEGERRVAGGQSTLPELFAKRPSSLRPPDRVRNSYHKYEDNIGAVEELLYAFKQGKDVALEDVSRVVAALQEDLFADVDLATNFANIKDGGSFQHHSANVATLCVGVGLALGYDERALKDLGLAALLHETGMLGVPKEILAKKSALSSAERQRISDHPIQALNYLEHVRGLSYRSLIAVYQEHECPDRSGYPNHRPDNLIHDFARIIAVCDAYEAMTAPRPFRQPFLPYHAVEQLIFATTKAHYAQEAMRGLLQLIGLFPVGSWIKLSNNCFAKVIGNNYEKYDRPVVAVLYDDKGQRLAQTEILDLLRRPALQVAEIVEGARFNASHTLGF